MWFVKGEWGLGKGNKPRPRHTSKHAHTIGAGGVGVRNGAVLWPEGGKAGKVWGWHVWELHCGVGLNGPMPAWHKEGVPGYWGGCPRVGKAEYNKKVSQWGPVLGNVHHSHPLG